MFAEVVENVVGLADEELAAVIEANEMARRSLDAEMSVALAAAKQRNLHVSLGHRTMPAYLRSRLNWSTVEATRRLSLARAVDEVPGLGEAWLVGRFGHSQAAKLAVTHGNDRVRDRLPEFAPLLIENAEQMPYSDFSETVDHFVRQADEDGAHDDRDAEVEGRSARVVGVAGTLDVRVTGGTGLVAAEMVAIHDRYVDIEFRLDVEARRAEHGDAADRFPLARTDRQRRFDAFVAIFRSASSVGEVGSVAEPLVNIAIDAHTWGQTLVASGLSSATDLEGRPVDPFTGLAVEESSDLLDEVAARRVRERRCETSNGVPLHPHDVVRAALAGHVRRVVVDSDHVVIDMGRRQRLFTGSARQAAKVLVNRCERAGCELPGDWCDVDHVDEWGREGGPTDQRNAAVLCRGDNIDKHRHRWRTRRAVNGCSYTIREDGSIVLPVGARPPDFGRDLNGDEDDDWDDGVESPEEVARVTAQIRRRFDDLIRSR